MVQAAPVQIDLLAWPDVQAAEQRTVAAHERWSEASRKYRVSPHGEVNVRLRALQDASEEVLRAELALQAVVRQASR